MTVLGQHVCLSFLYETRPISSLFFFFNDTATTEIYTLSLHDALPISIDHWRFTRIAAASSSATAFLSSRFTNSFPSPDRKSTRLNSSHGYISYAVFCLKKKTCSLDPSAERISSANQLYREEAWTCRYR